MADTFRIKRRAVGGAAGAPPALAAAELAYNEQTNILYYGGGNSANQATSIFPIAGTGFFAPLASPAFTGTPVAPNPAIGDETTQLASTLFVARTAQGVPQPNTGDADTTFVASQLDGGLINIIGTLTADRTVTIPMNLNRKVWKFRNGTTGGFNVNITTTAGLVFSIPPAYVADVWTNGINIFPGQSLIEGTTLRVGNALRNAITLVAGAATTNTAVINTTGTGILQFGCGVAFGSVLGASASDLTNHITLWGTAYGFSVTSGRLNHVAGGSQFFVIGTTDVGSFTTTGLNATAVGATTPSTGAFTTLAATGTVSGAGFTSLLAPYAPLASPTFTGTPTLPTGTIGVTQVAGTNNTTLATTAFVTAADIAAAGVVSFNTRAGAVVLTAADVTGVGGALLAGPTFTGVPAAPTAAPGTNTTQLATTGFVAAAAALYLPLATGGTVSGNLTVSGATLSITGTSPSGWGMILSNTATNGIILNGTYTSAAIRLSTNMAISFIATGVRNLYWDNVNDLPAGLKWSIGSVAAPNPVITLADLGYVQAASFYADGATGTWRGIRALTSGILNWTAGANLTATPLDGSNAGSDFDFNAYSDTGALIATHARITRATGLFTFYRGIFLNTQVAPGGVTDLSRHIALYSTTYGFNVVASPSSRLNYLVPSGATHVFVVNALDVGNFSSTGLNAAAVGATTPSTGAFTTLAATGAVSGAGFTTLLAPYAPLAAPALSGIPTAPTATLGTNTTQLATTAFVQAANNAAVLSFNTRVGAVTLLAADLTGAGGALLAGPTFTGTPSAPTATAGTGTTQLATCAFVQNATAAYLPIAGGNVTGTTSFTAAGYAISVTNNVLISGTLAVGAGSISSTGMNSLAVGAATPSTGAFTTLSATGVVSGAGFTTLLSPYAPLASPVFTGAPSLPTGTIGVTQAIGDEDTSLATVAFVAREAAGYMAWNIADADATWTTANANGRVISATGALTADRTVTIPVNATHKSWIVRHGGTGGFNVIFAAGTNSFSIPQGYSGEIWSSGAALFATHSILPAATVRIGDATRNAFQFTTGLGAAATSTLTTTGSGALAITGAFTAPTPATADNTTTVATTAFVKAQLYATLAAPALTGVPTAPTAAALTNTTQIATTAFVTTADNLKANLASPALSGVPTAPTAAPGTNTTQLATTAFVQAAAGAYLLLTGGSLSGTLSVVNTLVVGAASGQYASITLARQSGFANQIIGQTIGSMRWVMQLGDTAAESTGNAGSNFGLYRYADGGTVIDSPLSINRATGTVTLSVGLLANGGRILCSGSNKAAVTVWYPAGGVASAMWIENNGVLSWGDTDGTGTPITGRMTVDRSSNLYVAGAVSANGPYTNLSDARTKDDIDDANRGLAEVLRLRPVSFKRKPRPDDLLMRPRRLELGFIAQDMREVIPEAVSVVDVVDGDSDDPVLGVALDPIVVALVNGMKELAAQNAALAARVQQLEARTLH